MNLNIRKKQTQQTHVLSVIESLAVSEAEGTPDYVQGFYLALWSGITIGSVGGIICRAGDLTGDGWMQTNHLSLSNISLVSIGNFKGESVVPRREY